MACSRWKDLFLRATEMPGDAGHLFTGARQFRIFLAGGNAVADEEKIPLTFLLAGILPI